MIDELVRPHNPVIDLNTRFSGIESLEGATHTLESIHSALCKLIGSDTIIIGHGLENDLNALRVYFS